MPPSTIVADAAPDAQPVQQTLFSHDQLEAHAVLLAQSQTLARSARRGLPLLPRLERTADALESAYQFLSAVARLDVQTVGSEDWLRDNYYVVQDQIREVRRDLPRKYYNELPKLANGAFEGYPRVYVIAHELTTHTAGRLILETLVDFVTTYQRTAPLSIGETWAIPIMLRMALVEELEQIVARVVTSRESRERARHLESQGTGRDAWDDVAELLEKEVQAHGRLSAAYVVELFRWLRDQPPAAAPVWTALQHALDAQEDSADELLQLEHQREAADQVAMGNAISSMRLLSSIDWPMFFDRVSVIEQILRGDPAGAYSAMDFPTRDRYRHSIEQLAKRAKQTETAVAQHAVDLARAATREAPDSERRHHVGYYLISNGRFHLERDLAYPPSATERMARFFFRHPAIGYLGTTAALIAVGVASLMAYAARQGATTEQTWLVALLVLIPISELAISIFNAMLTSQIPPRNLPKLALRDGIPASDRALVVVPVITESPERVIALCRDLEVRFFANRDPNVHFALLSDFPDADAASMPGDNAIVNEGRRQIDALNVQYGPDRFFFLHRERRWNPSEGRWMGWERKRGKLTELNRLLRGAADTSFTIVQGDSALLPAVTLRHHARLRHASCRSTPPGG